MASFQVDGVCYSSALLAVKAMAAKEVGSILRVGTSQYVVDSPSQTASSVTYVLTNVSPSTTVSADPRAITSVQSVTPQPCGLLDTADGLVISWGIATAWLITAGVLFLRRGINE